MTDSVDECKDPKTGNNSMTPFGEGLRQVRLAGTLQDAKAKTYTRGHLVMNICPDGKVIASSEQIIENWDYCMGVLVGLGLPHVEGRTAVFFSGATEHFVPRLYAHALGNDNTIDVSAWEASREMACNDFERTVNLADTQTAMWTAVKDDVPPRLKDDAIDIIANMTNGKGALDTGFWLLNKNAERVHFEIHRGSLLRLSKDGRHVLACGADALFMKDTPLMKQES